MVRRATRTTRTTAPRPTCTSSRSPSSRSSATPAGTQASIFGTASINGSGTFNFRVDLKDLGEPGTSDTYRIRLSNGYDSGEQTLAGGNVQIH